MSRPSLDPSAPLAWWDKVRQLFHGRLTLHCAKFTCLLHVSLDPYNTTEEMELTWSDLVLDWTNGNDTQSRVRYVVCIWMFFGSVDVNVLMAKTNPDGPVVVSQPGRLMSVLVWVYLCVRILIITL